MGGKGEGTGDGVPPCPPPHITYSSAVIGQSSTAEVGGPGVVCVAGPDIKNLRVDNKCQQSKVTYFVYLSCN